MKRTHECDLRLSGPAAILWAIERERQMAKSKDAWASFKPAGKLPDYSGDKLAKAWKELHGGDLEPYPDEKRAAALIKAAGKSAPKGMDPKGLAAALQQAWRDFHAGDFKAAFD